MLNAMQELLGQMALASGGLASSLVLLVAWRHYERRPDLESSALLALALGGCYATMTLFVGAFTPLWLVYRRPELLEMLHRSRYLIFDCTCVPSVLWLLLLQAHRAGDKGGPLGTLASLLLGGAGRLPVLAAVALVHAAAAGYAAGDCARYPFTTENCLGVLYWRPARFTPKMRRPWLLATRALWIVGAYRCLWQGDAWLLLATAVARLAFNGHMSQWHHWRWEVFAQAPAMAALCAVLLRAEDVAVRCNLQSWDPRSCLVVTPGGAARLFAAPGGLRF